MRRAARPLALAVLAAFQTACLVDIRRVDDPGPALAAARAEAMRISDTPGPAHRLHVVAYDRGDRQLVRVNLPLWILDKAEDHVDWDDHDHIRRHMGRLRLRDLSRAGRGLFIEAVDEDGSQVMVWLR